MVENKIVEEWNKNHKIGIDCQKLEKKRVKKVENNAVLLKLSEGWISDE